jgi:hypothetical protein
MKPSRSGNLTFAGSLCVLGLSALSFGLASEPAPSEAAARPDAGSSHTLAATAKVETDSYVATMVPVGDGYTAGKEGTVEITITPKAKFHVNAQYPIKFKTVDPPPENITYPKPLLARADGTFSDTRGSFKLPFVAKSAGKVTVAGKLSLSVCSDSNCVMDKVDLELTVDAR